MPITRENPSFPFPRRIPRIPTAKKKGRERKKKSGGKTLPIEDKTLHEINRTAIIANAFPPVENDWKICIQKVEKKIFVTHHFNPRARAHTHFHPKGSNV
uniref:(northern house mosquito) hypothetical protein n=1 Tax=Culex pipiens TaxID=7175 RepID=A0A8D8BFX9_CULPI